MTLGFKCLISKLGMANTGPTRQGCWVMEIIHVTGLMQSEAYSKCSTYLSYHNYLLLSWPCRMSVTSLAAGRLLHQEGSGPQSPELSSVRSANAAREGDLRALRLHGDAALISQCLPGDGNSGNAGRNSDFCSCGSVLEEPPIVQVQKLRSGEGKVAAHRCTDARTQARGMTHRCPRLWHPRDDALPQEPPPPKSAGRAPPRAPPPAFEAVRPALPVDSWPLSRLYLRQRERRQPRPSPPFCGLQG